MSILDRLFGGGSDDENSCCDVKIEDVDSDHDERDMPTENSTGTDD
jgi:hypothetical protein